MAERDQATWWARPVTRRRAFLETAGGVLVGIGATKGAEFIGSGELLVVGGFSDLKDQNGKPLANKFVSGNQLHMLITEQPGFLTSIERVDISYSWQGALEGPMGGWPSPKSFTQPTQVNDTLFYYAYTLSLADIAANQEFQVGINVYGKQMGIPKKRLGTPFETFVKV